MLRIRGIFGTDPDPGLQHCQEQLLSFTVQYVCSLLDARVKILYFLMLLFGHHPDVDFFIYNDLILRVLFVQVLLVKERQVKRVIGNAT